MRISIKDPRLERLVVLYPGATRFPLADKVEAVPLRAIAKGFRFAYALTNRAHGPHFPCFGRWGIKAPASENG